MLQLKDDLDEKVRDSFTSLIAKFAGFNESNNAMQNDGLFTSLTPTGSNFMKIDSKVTLETDFRYKLKN